MTEIMSYKDAVLEIREVVANREDYIIVGSTEDMTAAIYLLGDRKCTLWLNANASEVGVFKIDGDDIKDRGTLSDVLTLYTTLFPQMQNMGIIAAVPKFERLPDKLPMIPGKDLICLDGNLSVIAVEVLRTLWPDSTVWAPEQTAEFMMRTPETTEA